jgi:hypothetical protein
MLSVSYDPQCQHDIDVMRPQGSSCCTLFASLLGMDILRRESAVGLSMPLVQDLLLKVVRLWDMRKMADGQFAVNTLREVAADKGCVLDLPYVERVMTQSDFQRMLMSESPPFAALVTAWPLSAGEKDVVVGNTFVVVSLDDGMYVVDSHRHSTAEGTHGTVIAHISGGESDAAAECTTRWLWGPCGLLEQLGCRLDMVDVTGFTIAPPEQAGRVPHQQQAPQLAKPPLCVAQSAAAHAIEHLRFDKQNAHDASGANMVNSGRSMRATSRE